MRGFLNRKNRRILQKRGQIILSVLLCLALLLGSASLVSVVHADPLEETSSTEPSTEDSSTENSSTEETSSLSAWEKEESRKKASSESASIASSLEESRSIAESEAESIFASMSAAEEEKAKLESEEYERKHLRVGQYSILKELSKNAAQQGFEVLTDSTTFDEPVNVFFQKGYNVSVYYATDGDEYGFYCYDSITNTLYPYTTLNVDGETFVVVTPATESNVPGDFITETTISIQSLTKSSYSVPAYKIMDAKKKPILLILLVSQQGFSNYYVYDDSSGFLKLTPYEDYTKELTSQKAITTQTKTIATKVTESTSSQATKGFFDDYVVWLLIIGIVIALLIIAVVVVIYLNKRQDAEEKEIDFDEEELQSPYEFLKQKRMMTSGYNSEQEDVESFDVNFENSFPEEMDIAEDETVDEEEKRLNELMDLEDQVVLDPDDYEEEEERPKKATVDENTQQVDFDKMRQEVSRFKQEEKDNPENPSGKDKKVLSEDDFDKIDF